VTKRVRLLVGAVALSFAFAPVAAAEPLPTPPPAPGSTNDELADMVMDAIQHGAPTTTPVPASPHP
jgi:hypothetical protein